MYRDILLRLISMVASTTSRSYTTKLCYASRPPRDSWGISRAPKDPLGPVYDVYSENGGLSGGGPPQGGTCVCP